MMIQILKCKIKGVIVSESNIDYPGSISLPAELMKATGIKQFEMVYVNNKTNGNRIITYAVENKERGKVTVNGAASFHFNKGDLIHVLAFAHLNENEAESFVPTLVLTDKNNHLVETAPYVFK